MLDGELTSRRHSGVLACAGTRLRKAVSVFAIFAGLLFSLILTLWPFADLLTTGRRQRAGYLREPLGSHAIQGGQVLHLEGLFERRRCQMLAGALEPLARMRFS